jgi:hypothetical protein
MKAFAKAAKRLGAALVDLYSRYPARSNSYILAAVVGIGGALGIAVDPESAGTVIKAVIPILILGEGTHHLVSPVR